LKKKFQSLLQIIQLIISKNW